MDRSPIGESAAAVAVALASHPWRDFSDHMLARRAVGAMDRHSVVAFLSGLPGADIGDADELEPVEAGDGRVDALVRALDGRPWQDRSLVHLSVELTSSVAAWHVARDADDPRPRNGR
ncbi:hypothetical protein ACI78T_02810 [Blastococcus sp. SYSU D00922]